MTFGLTAAGFNIMRQSDVLANQQAQLQQAFGQNVNFSGQSVLGQIFGIASRDLALLWELAEAVYSSEYPSGAEGTSVDNILALSNNKRKDPAPTKTAPTNTSRTPGLVFYGSPGTMIPANSIITVQGNPSLQFQTDAAVTIAAAVNAIQLLVFSAAPDSGAFQFTIVDPVGRTLTSASLPWYTPTTKTQISWQQVPTSGNFRLTVASAYGTFLTPSRPFGVSTAQVQTDIRALNAAYVGVNVSGSVSSTVLTTTGTITNGSFAITALVSTVGVVVGMQVAGANIPSGAYVTDIVGPVVTMSQAATNGATEAITFSGALTVDWGSVSQPTVSLTSDTLSPVVGSVVNSLQSAFNTLYDSVAGNYPYTDVTCTGSIAATSAAVNFGAGTGVAGQPVSAAQPQSAIAVIADTLQIGMTVVNIQVLTTGVGTATGAPAQAVGSATCTQNGPNVVPATFLSVIGSPVGGWTSVTNPLDCLTGANAESDTAALTRRNDEIASNASGPVAAIAGKVDQVPGVVKAVGFQNLSLAALQLLTFSAVPTSGAYVLGVNGGLGLQLTASISYRALANVQAVYFSGVPTGGSFTITMNSETTGAVAYTANAGAVQAAVQLLPGFANALVTGSFAAGFFLAFGAGAVQQYPLTVADSLTGASVSAVVPSIQAKINAVPGYGSATVIGSQAAGVVVAFNASTGGQPQSAITVPTNTLAFGGPVTITPSFGRPGKSIEIVVNDNNGEAADVNIAEAIFSAAPGGIMLYGNNLPSGNPTLVSDNFGAVYPISFSRPTQVPFYVVIDLQTDLTTSGTPQFSFDSILKIQEEVVAIGNAFQMGGLVVGFGSQGLVGCFNDVNGIVNYTIFFGTSPSPTGNANVQLLPEQIPAFETFLVVVTYQ